MNVNAKNAIKRASGRSRRLTSPPGWEREGRVRVILLIAVALVFGFVAGAVWYYRNENRAGTPAVSSATPGELSDATKAVLRNLDAPVGIRFYSLLDPATVPASMRDFARRVDQLLDTYEREAGGKIQVTRHDTRSDANADIASVEGLKPFNLDKGEACYLGLIVARNEQKEILPRLALEWEQALEFDLSRAIERVGLGKPASPSAIGATPARAAADEVKRLIPNVSAVSLEQGTQILREAALKDFIAAAREMETRVKEAQERLNQAQGQSEAEQRAALQHLRQIQTEHTEKLKEIAARLQAHIGALEQMKWVTDPPARARPNRALRRIEPGD